MSKEPVKKIGELVTLKFFDRMLDKETRRMSRMLEKAIQSAGGGRVKLLLFVESRIPANTPENIFESLKFLKSHSDHIEKIAIVGDRPWDRTYIGLFSLFGNIQINCFQRKQLIDAVHWLYLS